MPSLKHTHKYVKRKLGQSKATGKAYVVYACALPNCSHYLNPDLVVGKESVCWRCGEKFLVWKDSNGILAKPHCKVCTKKEDAEEILIPAVFPGFQ